MSKKGKRNPSSPKQPQRQAARPSASSTPPPPPPRPAPPPDRRKAIFIAAAIGLVVAFIVGVLLYQAHGDQASRDAAANNMKILVAEHSPTTGPAGAKVHIVEFLDPACETCAAFYPRVKQIMAANPDRIRLTVRHVPFHGGASDVVRILEAARKQGKYWEVLELLLRRQDQWVIQHRAHADRVWPLLAGSGLDLDALKVDMLASEISRRIDADMAAAQALGVNKTPEFFVNGRGLPRFGFDELQGLVREELAAAYP